MSDGADILDKARSEYAATVATVAAEMDLDAGVAAALASRPLPGDRCTCGCPRNLHSGYGLGRCLRDGGACRCPHLTPKGTP